VISRRRFLRNTLLGGALLGTAAVVGRHLSGYHLDDATASKLRALSPKEYLVLQAVVRRMLAGDAADAPTPEALNAALFVDGYLTKLDEGSRSDVRALLHLVEHGSGPFRFGLTRFTHMTPDEQDATLRDWESSRLAIRRRGFQALKSMAMLGYWRADATWPLIGYTGPMLPRRVPG
jgi:D-cysteine desulfhydrase